MTSIDDLMRTAVADAVRSALPAVVAAIVAGVRAELAPRTPHGLSRSNAARALECSVATVDRRVADGTLRHIRLGRSVRVFLDAPPTDVEIAALAREARS